MPEQQSKKKTQKRQHKVRSARQWGRTAKNINRRREAHRVAHPHDTAARANWEAHPVRYSK